MTISNEDIILTTISVLGICTVTDIQELFRGLSKAEINITLNELINEQKISEQTFNETEPEYSLITEKTQQETIQALQSEIEKLKNEISLLKKPKIKRRRKVIRPVKLASLSEDAKTPEDQLPKYVLETEDPDEALKLALAELTGEE